MNTYDIYDWDKSIQDWVWVGSDNGTIRYDPNKKIPIDHFNDDMVWALGLSHSVRGKTFRQAGFDEDHFIDEDKIIDTELVTIRGEETYLSKEESFYLLMHNQIFMKNRKIMTDEEKIKYYNGDI